MSEPFKSRSLLNLSEIASDIGRELSKLIDQHENVGAVLVLYELPGPDGAPDTAMSYTATNLAHVEPVLEKVLELVNKHRLPVLRGEKPSGNEN